MANEEQARRRGRPRLPRRARRGRTLKVYLSLEDVDRLALRTDSGRLSVWAREVLLRAAERERRRRDEGG